MSGGRPDALNSSNQYYKRHRKAVAMFQIQGDYINRTKDNRPDPILDPVLENFKYVLSSLFVNRQNWNTDIKKLCQY